MRQQFQTWHHLPVYAEPNGNVPNKSAMFTEPHKYYGRHFTIHPEWGFHRHKLLALKWINFILDKSCEWFLCGKEVWNLVLKSFLNYNMYHFSYNLQWCVHLWDQIIINCGFLIITFLDGKFEMSFTQFMTIKRSKYPCHHWGTFSVSVKIPTVNSGRDSETILTKLSRAGWDFTWIEWKIGKRLFF